MAQYLLEATRLDGETLLIFTYFWQKDVEKNLQSALGPRNVSPVPAIACGTILHFRDEAKGQQEGK